MRVSQAGDVIHIINENGSIVTTYTYSAFGEVLAVTGTLASTIGARNPFRYRSYYYDTETGWYYLNSRYYDPTVGRFINADSVDVLTATPNSLTDKNLYAYCDNNPVKRKDNGGEFWDIVFDVVSLVSSVVEVCVNPTDPMAWVGLAGDVVDLIPGVTGVGETIRAVDAAHDTYKAARNLAETAETLHDIQKTAENANDVKKVVENAGRAAKELHRPYIRKSTRQAVENAARRAPDGRFLDANTGEVITGKYDLGHIYGREFWREKKMAMDKGWTQKQFNDYMNNPDFYRIESPLSNRSHKFEMH